MNSCLFCWYLWGIKNVYGKKLKLEEAKKQSQQIIYLPILSIIIQPGDLEFCKKKQVKETVINA